MGEEQLGATTGGVWTTAQARAAGISPSGVKRRVAAGLWQVLRRGTYACGGVVPDARMRASAAVLAAGGPGRATAAGRTAARLHGLPLVDDHDPLLPLGRRTARHDDVATDRPGRGAPDLHVARLVLADGDRVSVGGVPCLSVARTLVDLVRTVPYDSVVCAVDAALHRQLLTPGDLEAAVAARAGAPSVALLRGAVTAADGRAESPLETLVRLLLLPALPDLVPQVLVLDDRAERVARLDLADERVRFAVEADGARWHRGEAALAADRRREARLARCGWRLERVTWKDVRADGARTCARVVEAHRRAAA